MLYSCQHNTISSRRSLLSWATRFGTYVPSSGAVFSYNDCIMYTWGIRRCVTHCTVFRIYYTKHYNGLVFYLFVNTVVIFFVNLRL
jgi:hypothetical protein